MASKRIYRPRNLVDAAIHGVNRMEDLISSVRKTFNGNLASSTIQDLCRLQNEQTKLIRAGSYEHSVRWYPVARNSMRP